MKDYKITIEQCKLLTELLGKCWHEVDPERKSDLWTYCYCKHCKQLVKFTIKTDGTIKGFIGQRTFTTDKDKDDVFRKLVDSGKWEKFGDYNNKECYAREIWRKEVYPYIDENTPNREKNYLTWLLYDSERFNVLVAMALEE
jgi:hypothetical protein